MFSTHRVLEHRVRAVVALLALALAAFGFSACGGGDSDSGGGGGDTAEVETLLTQTFTGTHKIESGKANLVLKVTTEGDASIRGPIELKVSGPFQTAGKDELPKFDLALDVHAQGQGFSAGIASTSDRLFVKFGGTAYEVPATLVAQMKQGFDSGSSSKGLSLDSLGIDPMSWLKDPELAGTETVGGVETEHITSGLDVNALLDDIDSVLAKVKDQVPAVGATGQQIPDRIPDDTRKQIEDAVKDATVDIWTGKDDKTLRKLVVTLAVEPPASSDGPKSLDISLSFELTDLNEPQSIEAPATTRPLSELLGQLQGLLGGALGGGALGGASGDTTPPNIDEYTECLQDAQGDVAKAQDCAELLNQ